MALYTDTVMDHFMHPRNVGEIADADGVGEVGNAKCGDIMKMYLKIDNGIITFEEMGELLEHREETDVVLTGTRMDDGLCRFADEIQEITDCPFCCFEGK